MKQGIIFTGSKITGDLIIEMLKDLHQINLVSDFEELINAFKFEIKDFLIIDRTLSKMTAKEVFRKLLDKGITSIPPSILLTQSRYNPAEDGEGYSFILRKPFLKNEISEAINFVLLEKEKRKLEKILIVDDSKTSRNFMKKILLTHGYSCIEAENATEGLKKAEEVMPDLIIVDYVMPDFTGVELAKKISENEKLKSVPIILITGSGSFNEVMEDGFNSGISAYFKKPFNEKEVFGFFKKYFYSDIASKVLVLDDSPTRRKALYSNLSINNNQVITVGTIDKAVALLEDNRFDIILTDLVLHNENAFDAVKKFRKINQNIPIIVYSSIADRKNIYKILEAGASDFLWSPIEMRELVLKVKIWLGYSSFDNLNKSFHKKLQPDNSFKNFMEVVDAEFCKDKLNKISSTLVSVDNTDETVKTAILRNIRKNDKFKKFNNKFFIYFTDSNIVETLKICRRIQKSLDIKINFGISSSESVKTIEEFFEKSEKNIVKL